MGRRFGEGGEAGFAAVGCDRWLQQSQEPIVRDLDQDRGHGGSVDVDVDVNDVDNSPRS